MTSPNEIDAVARLLSKGCWDGCEDDGRIEPCLWPPCPCRTAAVEILRAAESVRLDDKKKSCRHYNKIGNGSLSSDGSSSYTWFCAECGASGSFATPSATAAPPREVESE